MPHGQTGSATDAGKLPNQIGGEENCAIALPIFQSQGLA